MSGAVTRIGRARARTWSSFGNLGRKPSEYEVVTHNMNHTYKRDGSEPLEMGANVHGNIWLRQHRDAHMFDVADWDDFRDPDELTYRKYCHQQDEQETYIDNLLRDFTAIKKADTTLCDGTLQFLALAMTPCRYLGHGQMMLSAYIQQMAPSAYVGNCATFQTADSLRRVQRIAYRTKQLENAHPMRGFGSGERETWEKDSDWQPIRKAIEEALIVYDFDASFVNFQLVLKPLLDNLFLKQFAVVAKAMGADVDALIADNLYVDAVRSQRWTIAMSRFLIETNAANGNNLKQLLAKARLSADDIIAAGSTLLARLASPAVGAAFSLKEERSSFGSAKFNTSALADAIASRVRNDWTVMVDEAGVGAHA